MSIKVFTMTHKKFEVPPDSMYVPLHVGRELSSDLGYTGDNTGDNISELNCYYSELTGVYWIWKNYTGSEYVGVCHYRRYLINSEGKVFTETEFLSILKNYDLITTKKIRLECSYFEGYGGHHEIKDLIETGKVISEKYPEYYPTFEKIINSNETYFGNIMITSKKLFDQYSSWLFDIFFEVQKRVDIDSYDEYHRRVFGFISEMLLLVWVTVNKLKVFECTVGMTVEKIETKEMKEKLATYFSAKDIEGARTFFAESLKKRPDVLMEASDITGELKLSMQVIATCDNEFKETGRSVLNEITDFTELMKYFRSLNSIAKRYISGTSSAEDIMYLKENKVSRTAAQIAVMLFCSDAEKTEEIIQKIFSDMAEVLE